MYTTNLYGAVEYSAAKNGKEAPVDAAGNRAQYFKVSEFQCHNGEDDIWIQPALVSALDALRRDFFSRALRVLQDTAVRPTTLPWAGAERPRTASTCTARRRTLNPAAGRDGATGSG